MIRWTITFLVIAVILTYIAINAEETVSIVFSWIFAIWASLYFAIFLAYNIYEYNQYRKHKK